ncbi:MAG TPA: cellulase family glycosylhydrolase [Steroidobacteraceae bacterium]|nr:cellulase family glycosylhydrolase [Steroidobacteraceae bacterium]
MASVGLRACVPAFLVLALSACGGGSDSSSATAQANKSISISNTPGAAAAVGIAYVARVTAMGPAGAIIGYSIRHKPAWVSFNTKTGALTGTPTTSDVGNYPNVVVTASDGSSSASTPPVTITVSQPGTATASTAGGSSTAARPSYNTGSGFFVLNGKLYDANGNEFRIRGVNRVHWDSNSAAGIAKSGANTVRWDIDFTRPASSNVSLLQTQSIQYGNVPIAGNWTATCASDTGSLQAIVSTWVSQAAQWTTLNPYLIVNVANEWGPANSSVWRDAYISAISRLRGAGYTGPILVDAGGCGQDESDLTQYAQAVFQSDPERNIIFAEHLYGNVNDYSASILSVQKGNPTVITLGSNSPKHPLVPGYNGSGNSYSGISAYSISGARGMTQLNGEQPAPTNVGGTPGAWTVTLNVDSTNWPDYTGGGTIVDYTGNYALRIARMAAMEQSTGAVFIVGEFGPGENIGPSPTMATPSEIIQAAEAHGIGWLPWAWDDNDQSGGASDNNWFSMTYAGPGVYNSSSDLTNFGQDVVLNSTYGITKLAKPATVFSSL